jgi:hypothetical protein
MPLAHITHSIKRDMLADFPEKYVLLGCVEAEWHHRASQRTVRRWMHEYNDADLIQLWRSYLRKLAASLGWPTAKGRKPGARFGLFPELSARDPALAWMPVRRCNRAFPADRIWVRFPDARPRPWLE